MGYRVTFTAHCGMATLDKTYGDRQSARCRAARLLRYRRFTDHPVSTLERGKRWEVEEPEDCAMIPDTAGILRIVEVGTGDDKGLSNLDDNGQA